jgi:hypothetical protein
MSGDSEADLKRLRDMLGVAQPEESAPTPFAQNVAATLTQALATLRADGMIEVEGANVDALATEVVEAALESSSVKRLPLRIVKTLIHSDLVEEVYGTDQEISAALRPFLDGL